MSSALFEVKVYSSPLMVANVKLCPWSFPPLANQKKTEVVLESSSWLIPLTYWILWWCLRTGCWTRQ